MADMTPGKAVPDDQQLKKDVLTTWDALALSIAVIAPAMAAYNTSFAASVSGGSTPFGFLIAGLSSLALAYGPGLRRHPVHAPHGLGGLRLHLHHQVARPDDSDWLRGQQRRQVGRRRDAAAYPVRQVRLLPDGLGRPRRDRQRVHLDAVYTSINWDEDALGAMNDPAAGQESVERLRREAAQPNTTVIFGHDPAQWAALRWPPSFYT